MITQVLVLSGPNLAELAAEQATGQPEPGLEEPAEPIDPDKPTGP